MIPATFAFDTPAITTRSSIADLSARADVGPADVAMLFLGVAHAAAVAGDLEAQLRERHVAIILDGLRPLEASKLPGQPMSFAQLQRLKERAR